MWALILNVLKFVALSIGTASGVIGTIVETKNKAPASFPAEA